MKNLILLVVLAVVASAGTYNLVYTETHIEQNPAECAIAGACYHDGDQVLALVEYTASQGGIWLFDPYAGMGAGWTFLDPGNEFPFGVACGTGLANEYYTNDWEFGDNRTYFYTGTEWFSSPSFTSNDGRGMDVSSDGYIWETDGPGQLCRYSDGLADPTYWSVPEVVGEPSGLTFFEFGGEEFVAVAQYDTEHRVALYTYNGGSLDFQCFADFPVTGVAVVRGLAYSPDRESMFLVYQRSSDGYWCVIEAYVEETSALQSATWGSIKSEFE